MKLLAFDTSTEACSAALAIDGEVRERFELAPREHGVLLLGMFDQLLAEAQLQLRHLDGIAFGRGPGAFTGVRIAAAVAQGVAFAGDLPAVGISSLATLALGAMKVHGVNQVLAALDARMGEVYWGAFRGDGAIVHAVVDEAVAPPHAVHAEAAGAWFGAGSGWQAYEAPLRNTLGDRLAGWDGTQLPAAANMIPLALEAFRAGRIMAPEAIEPVYLRNDVV